MLNAMFGMRARDSNSGFVLGPRHVMQDLVTYKGQYRHFQTFISVSAKSKGYSILEVETLFESRNAGQSFISANVAKVVAGALADFVPAVAEFRVAARPRHGAAAVPAIQATARKHPYRGWRRAWFEAYFLTMPAHKWLIRRRARELYLDLKQTERLDRDALREFQFVKLQRLIQHAYVHVPYYRGAMNQAGLRPQDRH